MAAERSEDLKRLRADRGGDCGAVAVVKGSASLIAARPEDIRVTIEFEIPEADREYVRILVGLYEEMRDAFAVEWRRANDAVEALEDAQALLGRAAAWIKDDTAQAETAEEAELGQWLLDDIAEMLKRG